MQEVGVNVSHVPEAPQYAPYRHAVCCVQGSPSLTTAVHLPVQSAEAFSHCEVPAQSTHVDASFLIQPHVAPGGANVSRAQTLATRLQ